MKQQLIIKNTKGFVLPFTLLISSLILFITLGTMSLLSKQLYFSRLDQKSQTAYYAADNAVACAIQIDDTYVTADGIGIFPYSSTTNLITYDGPGGSISPVYSYLTDTLSYVNQKRINNNPSASSISLSDIKCAQATMFDTSPTSDSKFTVSQEDYKYHYINPISGLPEIEYGLTSSFDMRMPFEDGEIRCAKITVNKTPSFRQIISQGYSICDNPASAVERAIVNTTITN